MLYYYDSEKDACPKGRIPLNEGQITLSECGECKRGSYCFTINIGGRNHTQCTTKSKEQEEWLQALMDAGVTLQENAIAPVEAKSIFDFTVKDIDLQDFDLNQFRGNVCLVVNVASE